MSNGCLEWTGCVNSQGYGMRKVSGKAQYVHRIAYEATYGLIPDGMVLRHKCDNTLCFNPEHLEVGTQRDNMQDCLRRGRNPRVTLSVEQIESIKSDARPSAEAAKDYGISGRQVRRIRTGVCYSYLED